MKNTIKHQVKKVLIQETGKSITTQAGMIPVLKFWDMYQIYKALQNKLSLKHHYNAHWQLHDVVGIKHLMPPPQVMPINT